MRVVDLISRIEAVADPARAASWDRSGLQIAGTLETCTRLAVTLDPLPGVVAQALEWGAEVVLAHHPLTLAPRLPDRLDDYHRVLSLVLGRGASLYSAHTSLDVVTDGPAGWLADALELTGRRVLEPAGSSPFWSLRLAAGEQAPALRQTLAALPGVTAACLGPELVEAVCPARLRQEVLAAAQAVTGATLFAATQLAEPVTVYGYGLVGDLPCPLDADAFLARLGALLPRPFFTLAGTMPAVVSRVAYCPGSGADMAPRAFAAGAHVYVTGDLKYHQAQAVPPGRCLVDVGHFSLEEVMMRRLAATLAADCGPEGLIVRYFPGQDPMVAHIPDTSAGVRAE
jgi:dinuclear metal center YbgI/SA1388 family protein